MIEKETTPTPAKRTKLTGGKVSQRPQSLQPLKRRLATEEKRASKKFRPEKEGEEGITSEKSSIRFQARGKGKCYNVRIRQENNASRRRGKGDITVSGAGQRRGKYVGI